jgi:transcriptional regulator with XRE-family HTH domain
MAADPAAQASWSQRLAQALQAIRRKRRLSALEVARRMGMKPRSYSHFEENGRPISLERIVAFARATESDPYAILISTMIDAPALAVRVTDNKLISALVILLREFNRDADEGLALIETQAAISAFSDAFNTLAAAASARRENAAESWLNEELSKLGAADHKPKPDGA